MDLYTLDDNLKRVGLIEDYEAAIWAERYSAVGDLTIILKTDSLYANSLSSGTKIVRTNSTKVMTVEYSEDFTPEDNIERRRIVANSLETLFRSRMNRVGLTPSAPLVLTDNPADMVRRLVDSICRSNSVVPEDNIPHLEAVSLIARPGSQIEPDITIEVWLKLDTLYNSIKTLCDTYNLGFALYRDEVSGQLFFEVYTGRDLTTAQFVHNTVLLGDKLENIANFRRLNVITEYKNTAYVIAPHGSKIVYAPEILTSVSGFERRVLQVSADEITLAAGDQLQDVLNQRGLEELAKHRAIVLFDGEIAYNSAEDYKLGDLVTYQTVDNSMNTMRIAEIITVSDSEGEHNYVALATSGSVTFVSPSDPATAPSVRSKLWSAQGGGTNIVVHQSDFDVHPEPGDYIVAFMHTVSNHHGSELWYPPAGFTVHTGLQLETLYMSGVWFACEIVTKLITSSEPDYTFIPAVGDVCSVLCVVIKNTAGVSVTLPAPQFTQSNPAVQLDVGSPEITTMVDNSLYVGSWAATLAPIITAPWDITQNVTNARDIVKILEFTATAPAADDMYITHGVGIKTVGSAGNVPMEWGRITMPATGPSTGMIGMSSCIVFDPLP